MTDPITVSHPDGFCNLSENVVYISADTTGLIGQCCIGGKVYADHCPITISEPYDIILDRMIRTGQCMLKEATGTWDNPENQQDFPVVIDSSVCTYGWTTGQARRERMAELDIARRMAALSLMEGNHGRN